MKAKVEIIALGGFQEVTETQINQLREFRLSWHSYCHARLTHNHIDAIAHMMRNRQAWPEKLP